MYYELITQEIEDYTDAFFDNTQDRATPSVRRPPNVGLQQPEGNGLKPYAAKTAAKLKDAAKRYHHENICGKLIEEELKEPH